MIQDGVYRCSPQSQTVQGVISCADVVNANGVRSDATGRYLYVIGLAAPFVDFGKHGQGAYRYQYTLDEDCLPINETLVVMMRSYADGLHIDNYGRIWIGEWEGTYMRSSSEKVLGVFNAEALQVVKRIPPMANFAQAGDKLVILALDRFHEVQLGQNVTSLALNMQ